MTPATQPLTRELSNGTVTTMAYDAAGRMEGISNRESDGDAINYFTYEFDGAGNRTGVAGSWGTIVTWTYDGINQLTVDDAYRSGGFGEDWEYEYDPAGNRSRRTNTNTGEITTYTYDNANRLLSAEDSSGITTYTYDDNGNQLTIEEPSGDITTNTWDYENRLVQVEHPDSTISTFAYNGDGQKVEKDDGMDVTRLVYDGNSILLEQDGMGALQAEFTCYPQPQPLVISQYRIDMNGDGESGFYHPDGIANIANVTDDTQMVTDSYFFSAFGENYLTPATDNPQQYKGEFSQYRRDGDDIDNTYRQYKPDQGRYNSEDPARARLNPYPYCDNNPVNEDDPSGLEPNPHQLTSKQRKEVLAAVSEIDKLLENERRGGWGQVVKNVRWLEIGRQ